MRKRHEAARVQAAASVRSPGHTGARVTTGAIPSPLQTHEVEQLGHEGYFLRPDWLSIEVAEDARAAFQALDGFLPACVGRGEGRRELPELRGDELRWLDGGEAGPGLTPVLRAFEQLKDELNQQAYLGLDRRELQGARYLRRGALYTRHVDSFQGLAGRRVTFIYYLNPGWLPAHGGCLRLHLKAGAVDVPPRLNSLVVFLSEQVEHEVLASFADRSALTAWWSGRSSSQL